MTKAITTTAELIEQYNDCAKALGKPEVKRFASATVGAKRLAALRAQMPKAKPAKVAVASKSAPSKVGKVSELSGRKLFPARSENPRKLGSHGHRSLAIIFANPGITYEQFIELGGRNVDAHWDISHGNARVG